MLDCNPMVDESTAIIFQAVSAPKNNLNVF